MHIGPAPPAANKSQNSSKTPHHRPNFTATFHKRPLICYFLFFRGQVESVPSPCPKHEGSHHVATPQGSSFFGGQRIPPAYPQEEMRQTKFPPGFLHASPCRHLRLDIPHPRSTMLPVLFPSHGHGWSLKIPQIISSLTPIRQSREGKALTDVSLLGA